MRHHGPEPPWLGEDRGLGTWRRGEELWDGTGYVWEWVPPDPNWGSPIWHTGQLLKKVYVPVLKRALEAPMFDRLLGQT